MPAILNDESHTSATDPIAQMTELHFSPVTKAHILNCSYHSWHPKYRTITPKSRIIPLTQPFLDYLRADGIVLPSDNEEQPDWDSDSGVFSASDNPDAAQDDEDEDEDEDVAAGWRDTHETIKSTIADLGGNVVPKLNWSAPKDATWMNSNTMECRNPSDVYLLLKSSDFVTHDLEYAFDDCVDSPASSMSQAQIPYHLVLRKYVQFNPSVEFRCFVRRRKLLGVCQRDLNYFDFLFKMEGKLRSLIQEFFDVRLRDTFEDENFVFDVYVPAPYRKVWLVDINPWAPRTDPLLFSWMEMLTMSEPPDREAEEDLAPEEFVRLPMRPSGEASRSNSAVNGHPAPGTSQDEADGTDGIYDEDDDSDVEDLWLPELRLVRRSDPEAYSFATPQYSAHKLPKDVVDASQSGEGLREFARDWQNILARRRQEDAEAESSSDDD